MSARASAQLQRLEIALRPGFNQRASLRSASSYGAWEACGDSVEAACEIVGLLTSDQGSGAALWIHWRKSSASKQFLVLLKAISEAIASEADWMPAAAAGARRLRLCMVIAWTYGMDLLRQLYKGTQAGVLWPALRDWLAENDNLQGLWGGLARCSSADDATDILVVHDLVSMTYASLSQRRLPPALLQHPHVAAALGRALCSILPACFARAHGVDQSLRVLEIHGTLLNILVMATKESQLWQHLHLPALSLWPYLVEALRRQREGAVLIEDLQVSYQNPVCIRSI